MTRRFISFEGVDGCGKSTQAALLADTLQRAGGRVVRTREPGGTALGEELRRVLLQSSPGAIGAIAEMHLFAAARAQLVQEVIVPALEAGDWVVADRFLDSSLAYQGVARGLGIEEVLRVNEPATAHHMPARTILIDVDARRAAARRAGAEADDRIEAEGTLFQARVAAGYRELAERFPVRVRVVDGAGTPDEVHARVVEAVGDLMVDGA
jgi:dTMP kinase